MDHFKSNFLHTLQERGFIHQTSNNAELDALLLQETTTAYIGFDCTAPSLHVGSLVPIMMLYWLQQTGHRPLILMGSGTTRIGDPSGRDETRKVMTPETIEANKRSIAKIFNKFLKSSDDSDNMIIADNADWLLALNYVDFLRDYGRYLSVNQMLARDSVRLRLERKQHLSFLEFNYMCFQAYDFVELHRRYGCRMQMGGSDQWGNILSGVELGRKCGTQELFALTCPLLTTASGTKMGKSVAGAIWLDEDCLSAYDYWQYWRNTEDADVSRFLKLYTTLPLSEIEHLASLRGEELNEAKKILATETTTMVHGRKAAERAAQTAQQTFEAGRTDANLPSISIGQEELYTGVGLLNLLVRAKLARSNSEARHHLTGNAIRVNGKIVSDPKTIINTSHQDNDGMIKLSVGKKRHILVRSRKAHS